MLNTGQIVTSRKMPRLVYIGSHRIFLRDQVVAWLTASKNNDERSPARGRGKGRRRRQ